MKQKPLTVRDVVRGVSRILSPVANTAASALTVSQYVNGQEIHGKKKDSDQNFLPTQRATIPRRPSHQWDPANTWGADPEVDRHERELWLDGTFWNDADQGVTYGESTWDGQWNDAEAWRR